MEKYTQTIDGLARECSTQVFFHNKQEYYPSLQQHIICQIALLEEHQAPIFFYHFGLPTKTHNMILCCPYEHL